MERRRISNNIRAWLPVLPFALLLFASYWLSQQVQPLPPVDKTLRHDVDYTIDHLTTTTLDDHGQPRFTLSAEKMWHYPDDDTTHLLMPSLTNFSVDRPQIHTSAQLGTLSHKADDLFLYTGVHIVTTAVNQAERSFQTEYLHVVPDREWAETDRTVLMQDGRNDITAVGMELDNQAHTIKMLSQVRANHAPIPK